MLWQRDFTKTLIEAGFTQIPHEPCCFVKDRVIVFFYIDDLNTAFRKSQEGVQKDLIKKLWQKCKLSNRGPI